MNKVIPLSLSRSYVSDWSIENAVRELIQNAVDCDEYEMFTSGDEIHIYSY